MERKKVKIGELNFYLVLPADPEVLPSFEIENDASMVFETLDANTAIQLRDLLQQYIDQVSNS